MPSTSVYKKKLFSLLGKTDMELGKKMWLCLIGNGAKIWPLEKGRKFHA